MRKFFTQGIYALITLLSFNVSSAQSVSITNLGVPYTQDFNSLAASGTSSTLPPGWYLLESGSGANTTYAAGDGFANSGNTYSFGTGADIERSLGTLLSGSVTPLIGAQFTNNTTSTITSISFSFNGEQWRLGTANRADKLDFQYSLNATSLATASGVWTDVNTIDFTAPVTTGTLGMLDGNASANRTAVTSSIATLSIAPGATFWIRWVDFNATGADDGLGIDDLAISFNGTTVPACTEPANGATNLVLTPGVTSISGSFNANATATDEYLVLRSTSSTLSVTPADGSTYSNGQVVGNATVISSGSATAFNNTGLTSNTTYYYFVFIYNNEACSGGPNYLSTSLNGNATTLSPAPCVSPSTSPINLTLNAGSTSVSGTFTAATDANRYLTVRSPNASISFVPANGITYSAGQTFGAETIVSYSAATSFSATGLTASTTYYFYIFAANGECSGEPFYNTNTLQGSQTTLASGSGIPAGYYSSITNQTCNELKTALFNIIRPTVPNPAPDYGGICFIYPATDLKRSDDNLRDIIWDMYSDNPTGPDPYEFEYGVDVDGCGGSPNNPPIPGSNEGLMYNREHSFPRNWFGGAVEPMNSDIMHIFPTDKEVNAVRGNYPYGRVTSPGFTSLNGGKLGANSTSGFSGIVFEPIDAYKGDLARAQFYMITAYENLVAGWELNKPEVFNGTSYPSFDSWYLQLMYQWHLSDPVSTKETERNNAVYSIQGNRNPFVDHPEYVQDMLVCSGVIPVTLLSFTAKLKNSSTALLNWSATQETNFRMYEIERGTNGATFEKIGEVPGRNFANYHFTDAAVPQKNVVFYRLKMIDIDGKFSYSPVVALKLNNNFSNALIYPNPASGDLNIQLFESLSAKSTVQVTDVTGRKVKQQIASAGDFNITVDVRGLPAGRYFIRISNNDQLINQSFVVL